MTRNDFEVIASVIATDTPALGHWQAQQYRIELANAFADRLQLINPRFNRATFLRACGC
jgi:hypothetical protein